MSPLIDRMISIMKQHGINAKKLTEELNISSSSFTDWSKGKGTPSLDKLVKFADYFDVSLDYLVYGKEKSTNNTLEFSNQIDRELLEKFHTLSPDLQERLLMYVDGMIAAMPKKPNDEKRLSIWKTT